MALARLRERVPLLVALFALGLMVVWVALALVSLVDPLPAHGAPMAPFRWMVDEVVA